MVATNGESVEPGAVDMFTMVVLRRRFEAIIGDMVNALFKSGRSGVLNTAKDFTCSITDSKLQNVSAAVGLPVHAGAIDLIPRAVIDKFGEDIEPGDCFANNSAYHGNTHCGDFTLCAPVFFEGKLIFYTIARAHLADMGFPTPTTYGPLSRDVYEEGLILPCVRIQRSRKDVQEVIDICQANIRAPSQFYGDYLACLAAVRTGERGIEELCKRYGRTTVLDFLDQYQDYAERMAIEAIRKLPAARVEKEAWHDGVIPGGPGIPVRAILTVDPAAAMIEIDLRQNVDNLALGINMSESTTTASCRNGVLSMLGPDIPRCTGAYKRVRLLMREGAAVGKPRFPAATSAATTNLCQVLSPLVQSLFAEVMPRLGAGFSTVGNPASCAVVSGRDTRHGNRAFANQIIMGYWGGGGVYGHDGWVTNGGSGAAGVLNQASVEVVEQQQPIIVERLEVAINSAGPGQWDGGPGALCVYRARQDNLRFTSNSGGRDHPPAGTGGGVHGGENRTWKIDTNGLRTELPPFLDAVLHTGEKLVSQACGGGGFGNPLDRDPALVAARLQQGWITSERAVDGYGVIAYRDGEHFIVDDAATAAQRQKLRAAQGFQA
ncbi:hydantoinase B/oxoprolinase family protein [Acidisphaera sp. L21]|uniref:hydantoinase B/oxoprolinase family protein n=1 Tax=Acidisphaera sp. L21 TaxID=1641851 RepID=UPI001C208AC6|nr:hydantoinase B/oxoprolinase family protein [Acidisphaera sp. L21]